MKKGSVKENRKGERVTFRLTTEEKEALQVASERLGVSVTEYVRITSVRIARNLLNKKPPEELERALELSKKTQETLQVFIEHGKAYNTKDKT